MSHRAPLLSAALVSFGLFAAPIVSAVEPPGTLVTTPLHVESFIPLAEIDQHQVQVVRAVDPLAIYSNITNFSVVSLEQAPASGGITRMIMDDVTFTTDAAVGNVATVRFSVANLGAVSHSVRAHLRFWNADGAPLNPGQPDTPGTYYSPDGSPVGFTFAATTFDPGVTIVTAAAPFSVPAGTTTTLWAGIAFDNVGSTTGATDLDLSSFGQALVGPVDVGSSEEVFFLTNAAGSFFDIDNPAGSGASVIGSPSNMGWEFVVDAPAAVAVPTAGPFSLTLLALLLAGLAIGLLRR